MRLWVSILTIATNSWSLPSQLISHTARELITTSGPAIVSLTHGLERIALSIQ
jgi:hypothetical protein